MLARKEQKLLFVEAIVRWCWNILFDNSHQEDYRT